MNLLREKFDVVIVAIMFVTFAGIWIGLGFPDQMREIVGGLFVAFLTVIGLRPRLNQTTVQTEHISADVVETAKTEHGDINAGEIQKKEKEIEK